jgi:hypothetical protein
MGEDAWEAEAGAGHPPASNCDCLGGSGRADHDSAPMGRGRGGGRSGSARFGRDRGIDQSRRCGRRLSVRAFWRGAGQLAAAVASALGRTTSATGELTRDEILDNITLLLADELGGLGVSSLAGIQGGFLTPRASPPRCRDRLSRRAIPVAQESRPRCRRLHPGRRSLSGADPGTTVLSCSTVPGTSSTADGESTSSSRTRAIALPSIARTCGEFASGARRSRSPDSRRAAR